MSGVLDFVWSLGLKDSRTRLPVDFWFDPVCPWTWLTSRWILEVEKIRPLAITWHVMSLAVLNEARLDELSEANRELMGQAWAPVRILTAAAQVYGPDVLGPLYTALGNRYFPQRQPKTRPVIEAALREAGLPADLADAGDNNNWDEALLASHCEGITLVGADVGSPIIAIPGSGSDVAKIAFFGPVVNPAPKGVAAAHVWDSTLALVSTPGFYEIKRTRTDGPLFD
jgi:hypothetical protein